MAKTVLYTRQAFAAGDFSWGGSPAYRGINASKTGWNDAAISGYPELWLMERVFRDENAGPNGEHAVHATSAGVSWASGFGLGGFGGETRGQFDLSPAAHGSFTIEWDQEFRQDYWDVSGFGQLVFVGMDYDHIDDAGVEAGAQSLAINAQQTSGYGFYWEVQKFVPDYGANNFTHNFSNAGTATFSIANQWRTLKLVIIPSTVTGAFVIPGPHPGSSTVAADGIIRLYSKLYSAPASAYALEFELTGQTFVINPYETVAGRTTWGKGISFGEPTLVGGFTNIEVYWEGTGGAAGPITANNTTPCCSTTGAVGGSAGTVLPPDATAPLPPWEGRCSSGGVAPTGVPVTNSESWSQQ